MTIVVIDLNRPKLTNDESGHAAGHHAGAPLSLAMGCATAQQGERFEAVVTRADERMFEGKRGFYTASGFDRRTRPGRLED